MSITMTIEVTPAQAAKIAFLLSEAKEEPAAAPIAEAAPPVEKKPAKKAAPKSEPAPTVSESPAPQESPAPSFTDIRAVLATKSREGHTAKVQALLAEYGTNKLSGLSESVYAEFMAKAKEIG